ncbi:hypothetical protein ACI3PL_28830, partial [Lacticaseibacillus paracasei]
FVASWGSVNPATPADIGTGGEGCTIMAISQWQAQDMATHAAWREPEPELREQLRRFNEARKQQLGRTFPKDQRMPLPYTYV